MNCASTRMISWTKVHIFTSLSLTMFPNPKLWFLPLAVWTYQFFSASLRFFSAAFQSLIGLLLSLPQSICLSLFFFLLLSVVSQQLHPGVKWLRCWLGTILIHVNWCMEGQRWDSSGSLVWGYCIINYIHATEIQGCMIMYIFSTLCFIIDLFVLTVEYRPYAPPPQSFGQLKVPAIVGR